MHDSHPLRPELLRWSQGNAAALALVAIVTAAGLPLWVLSLCGVLSFSLLVYRCRRCWTPSGRFGPANAISLLRVAGTAVLPWLAPAEIACCGLVLLALDGTDGWIARRTGLAGEFGEFVDKEADAFFMLMLCALLHRLPGGFGPWILLPGLLRYLFVLFVWLARPPQLKEQRTAKAAWISILMTLTLLSAFAAYPDYVNHVLAAAIPMALVLVYSFAASLWLMYGARENA